MLVLNALMKPPVSLSCWGQFEVGRLPVEVKAMDYGIVSTSRGEEYLSVFHVGTVFRESRVCADRDLNAAEGFDQTLSRRLQCDLEALAAMGVDPESIDWNSSSDTESERAKWRAAVQCEVRR